jgi:hypothetical protein
MHDDRSTRFPEDVARRIVAGAIQLDEADRAAIGSIIAIRSRRQTRQDSAESSHDGRPPFFPRVRNAAREVTTKLKQLNDAIFTFGEHITHQARRTAEES